MGKPSLENNRNYTFYADLDAALPGSDVILTDSLLADRRNESYLHRYQITLERMRKANEQALLNPCPPFYRNEEVSIDAIASEYFVGYDFKKVLITVQQAVLLYCSGITSI
ncbi:hypothetical protein [Paenibacillus sp. MBLB4367]|uniref:hypothetical protein n=1 Tax=Paenibacillus sp. MBLB4367 TaxID=3384767 RepID=UPI00390829A9